MYSKSKNPNSKYGETYKIFEQRKEETNVSDSFKMKNDTGC